MNWESFAFAGLGGLVLALTVISVIALGYGASQVRAAFFCELWALFGAGAVVGQLINGPLPSLAAACVSEALALTCWWLSHHRQPRVVRR